MTRDGYRGPTPEGKKKSRRRIDARGQKGGKKIFSAGAKARERRKNHLGGSEKKSGVDENTTHKKSYVQ